MEILLLVTARAGEPSAVLPALDLLPHSVRTAPRDVRTLVSGPSPDAVLVDARSELSEARATCRMLHATGLGVPLVAVVTEAGLVALNADWGVDDVILASAGPAEVEARLRLAVGRLTNATAGAGGLDPGRRADHRPRHLRRQAQGPAARPHLQGVRAAEVPGPAPGPGLHPRPAAARGLGLRLLRRHPHGRRARAAAARQARLGVRVDDRHRPPGRLQVRGAADRASCPTASRSLPVQLTGAVDPPS